MSGRGSKNAMKTFHKGRSPWQSFFEKQRSWKNFKFCNLIHLHIYESETVMFYGKPHWMLKNTANICLFWYMNFDFLILFFFRVPDSFLQDCGVIRWEYLGNDFKGVFRSLSNIKVKFPSRYLPAQSWQ